MYGTPMTNVICQTPRPGLLEIVLNRPDAGNAFDHSMIGQIREAFLTAAGDDSVRLVMLRGAGPHFCAGGDIGWMQQVLAASASQKRAFAQDISLMYQAVHGLPQPLLIQVQGVAMGGGLGLVCCGDVVIADESARFALSEARIGIVPAAISPYLVSAIGARQAGQLALRGNTISAQDALRLGLVTHIASEDDNEPMLESTIKELFAGAPEAQRLSKCLFREISVQKISDSVCTLAVDTLVKAWSQPEAIKGFDAFLNRRLPPWRNEPPHHSKETTHDSEQ